MIEGTSQNFETILSGECEVLYFPSLFSRAESDLILEHLKKKTPWKQEWIRIFGRRIPQPRLTAWYGTGNYKYSGHELVPLKWSARLLRIRKKTEVASGHAFNSALLNYYRNGKDSVGWHRDNEKVLGPEPVIASLSFGAERKFELRRYDTKDNVIRLFPGHGSLLLMRGRTQLLWEHRVPAQKQSQARINVTFRQFSPLVNKLAENTGKA
jgi:alkylated DNA repair dioxygenase AlkB